MLPACPHQAAAAGHAGQGPQPAHNTTHILAARRCPPARRYGAFGQNMHPALFAGGPTPIGGRKANLSEQIQPWVEEASLGEGF